MFDPFERFFSAIFIFLLIVCSLFYFYRGSSREDKQEKVLMFTFGVFWISIASTKLYFYFVDYFIGGFYTGDIDAIFQTYDVETYILLYFYLYLYFFDFISLLGLCIIYIWSSFRSKRESRAISYVMAIGYILLSIGWALEVFFIKNVSPYPRAMPSILLIIGVLFTISPFFGYFELFNKLVIRLAIFIVIGVVVVFLALTLVFNLQLDVLSIIIILVSVALLVFVIVYILFSVIRRRERESEVRKEEIQDTIKMFTRPLNINIKDVKMYREKGLCLVCKNRISRLTYVCPQCESLYCYKCSSALSNLENMCWVCETPFDESKKVKMEKSSDEEIIID
jgi:hypothetical protein